MPHLFDSRHRPSPSLPSFALLAVALLICTSHFALPSPSAAWTLEENRQLDGTFIGYTVHLEQGDSLSGAWHGLKEARSQLGGGTHDVMHLPPGTTPIVHSGEIPILNHLNHVSFLEALIIKGSSEGPATLDCSRQVTSPCIGYRGDLTFEDVELTDQTSAEAFAMIWGWYSDITLRRVRIVGQSPQVTTALITAQSGSLVVEDSLFVDNSVPNGALLAARPADPTLSVSNSVFTGNVVEDLLKVEVLFTLPGNLEIVHSSFDDNDYEHYVDGIWRQSSEHVLWSRIERSILPGLLPHPRLDVVDSYVGDAPRLLRNASHVLTPLPGSPVVDAVACPSPAGVDLLGNARGVRAGYFAPRGTDCDLGAVEAPHAFCMAQDRSADPEVRCDGEGSQLLSQLPDGCRTVGGVLDCTGGTEVALTVLYPNEAAETHDAQLIMQGDGNLVLYDRRDPSQLVPVWAPGTNVEMQPDHVDPVWNGGVNIDGCIGWVARFEQTFWVLEDDGGWGGRHCWAATSNGQSFVVSESAFLRDGMSGHLPQVSIEYLRDGYLEHQETADGAAAWMSPIELLPDSSFVLRGTILRPDGVLSIPDAMAVHQQDGNFVLYEWQDDAWTPTWDTKTFGRCAGMNAVFRADGEWAIGQWQAGCDTYLGLPPGGVALRLRRDTAGQAKISLYDDIGRILWQVPFAKGQATAERGSLMSPDDQLEIDGARFILQRDGNLVLYEWLSDAWQPTWASGTAGVCTGASMHFQVDGELSLGAPGAGCHWSPLMATPEATELRLQRDINGVARVSLLDSDGNVLWQVP